MKRKLHLVFLTLVLILCNILSKAQPVKGFYVNDFSTILGNSQKEDSLLSMARSCQYNYMVLYDLWTIHTMHDLTNVSTSSILADFMRRAKQDFGIQQIGACGESFFFFNNVIQIYNQQHSDPLEKFDVYNVEFEFWNTSPVSAGGYYCTTYLAPGGYSCDTAGAFSYYRNLLHEVDSLGDMIGVVSETYVGWFNQGQAINIGNEVDRILLHDYISSYSQVYSYIQTRLQYLAARNIITNVIPLFSAEPTFLGPWIASNSITQPYLDVQSAFTADTGSWKQYINLQGYQWFVYSFLPLPPVALAGSDTTICAGGFVNLTASGGWTYSWSPTTALNDSSTADPVANPSMTMTYVVTAASNGCFSKDSTKISVAFCDGINSPASNDEVNVFPNPVNSGTLFFQVEIPGFSDGEIRIVDSLGNLLLKQRLAEPQRSISVETFPSGIYFWELRNASGSPAAHGKIIVE